MKILSSIRLGMIASALCFASALTADAAAAAPDATLQVTRDGQTRQWSRSQLLSHPAMRAIKVKADVAYGRSMRYRAVPLGALLGTVPPGTTIQFTATDGFVANIPSDLLNGGRGRAQAWVAIEPRAIGWPELKPGKGSAGPFYLVWLDPQKSGVSSEQWPYQVARIAQATPLAARYPQMVPAPAADSAAQRGMQVFVTNCAVCHRMHGGGDAQVGPDLGTPFGPTEYFQEAFLRRLIRDPASVRNWNQRAMPGFSTAALPDAELDDLLAYLRQMAMQRLAGR